MSDEVVRFEGVSKAYRRSHLGRSVEQRGVSELSFTVRRGEAFGLIGLNGSGKTTTIKLLLGLLRPNRGAVTVFGRRMPDAEALAKVGYLPESAVLSRHLTGRETLELYGALSGVPRPERAAAVDRTLRRVGMAERAGAPIASYSKGMTQRVAMAQALLHDPELLVLDEPVSGLDPRAVRDARALIDWFKGEGRTVLVSSHDIAEVGRVCGRAAILSQGRLARVVDAAEWNAAPGGLEGLFEEAADRTEGVDPLDFAGHGAAS